MTSYLNVLKNNTLLLYNMSSTVYRHYAILNNILKNNLKSFSEFYIIILSGWMLRSEVI